MKFARYGVLIFIIISSILIFPSFKIQANTKSIPARYDWREHGYDFPVRNQGLCEAGYAFAAIDAVQAAIWLNDDVKVNLSENNAKECNWHAINHYVGEANTCEGGNFKMLSNLFTQDGLVLDACDPYVDYDSACNQTCPYQYRITEWQEFSPSYSQLATNSIKQLIIDYGPLYSQMDPKISGFADYTGIMVLVDDSSFDANKYTHGVLIIGWDDDLAHTGGKGAWIVKNSYGTDWGNEGYFYLAYGSAGIGTSLATVTEWERPSIFDNLQFFDEAGYTTHIAPDENNFSNGTSMALFHLELKESMQAVEIWTNDASIVNLKIFESFDGNNLENLLFQASDVSFLYAGYHQIEVIQDFSLAEENEIAVVVNVQNQSNFFPITLDNLGPPSDNKSWYLDKDGNWHSFMEEAVHQYDTTIRLRTFKIPEGFNHTIYMPTIFKD